MKLSYRGDMEKHIAIFRELVDLCSTQTTDAYNCFYEFNGTIPF